MDASLLDDVECHTRAALNWKCELWFPPRGEEVDGAPPVDLVKMLSFESKKWLKDKAIEENLPNKTRYRFPDNFVGMDSAKELVCSLGRAAIQCGFELPISNR